MKDLLNKVKNVEVNTDGVNGDQVLQDVAMCAAAGTDSLIKTGLLVIKGTKFLSNKTVEGSKVCMEKGKELAEGIKEKAQSVDVRKYKDKVQGFSIKSNK